MAFLPSATAAVGSPAIGCLRRWHSLWRPFDFGAMTLLVSGGDDASQRWAVAELLGLWRDAWVLSWLVAFLPSRSLHRSGGKWRYFSAGRQILRPAIPRLNFPKLQKKRLTLTQCQTRIARSSNNRGDHHVITKSVATTSFWSVSCVCDGVDEVVGMVRTVAEEGARRIEPALRDDFQLNPNPDRARRRSGHTHAVPISAGINQRRRR